jgi:hypothetical protein
MNWEAGLPYIRFSFDGVGADRLEFYRRQTSWDAALPEEGSAVVESNFRAKVDEIGIQPNGYRQPVGRDRCGYMVTGGSLVYA